MQTTQVSQNTIEQEFENLWYSESMFTKDQVEHLADESITLVVSSQEFDVLDHNERTSLINYIVQSKRAMYRCYFE